MVGELDGFDELGVLDEFELLDEFGVRDEFGVSDAFGYAFDLMEHMANSGFVAHWATETDQ